MPPHQTSVVTELRGNLIRLRPFDPREIEAAWKGLALQDEAAHPRPRPEDRRPQPSESFRRRLKRSGTLWRGCLDLAIDREGRLVGQIQARTSPKQTLPAPALRKPVQDSLGAGVDTAASPLMPPAA